MSKTKKIIDSFGMLHYTNHEFGFISTACSKALKERNVDQRTWFFWFNDTPTIMMLNDNVETLIKRWLCWRTIYQSNNGILKQLEKLRNEN